MNFEQTKREQKSKETNKSKNLKTKKKGWTSGDTIEALVFPFAQTSQQSLHY
jgi:hypothetical protein